MGESSTNGRLGSQAAKPAQENVREIEYAEPIWEEDALRTACLEALPARMTHLVVARGDFTRVTPEQLQAPAEASSLGEHLQERKTGHSTASSPASLLAVREPGKDSGNQCFERGANEHWARDCP